MQFSASQRCKKTTAIINTIFTFVFYNAALTFRDATAYFHVSLPELREVALNRNASSCVSMVIVVAIAPWLARKNAFSVQRLKATGSKFWRTKLLT
jgi:hypothetical protein